MKLSQQEKQQYLDTMKPLFERAEREGLWFYFDYHHRWFTPNELRRLHENDSYLIGMSNWELRDPKLYLEMHEKKLADAAEAHRRAVDKYAIWKADE